ncbi:MAG TPA: hypothetical protein VF815_33195 [Myxococcaceae bacterium]|jgi:hypothetical protein
MNRLTWSCCWLFALALASGCATPAATKEASRLHGQNLVSLEKAVLTYRSTLADYYTKITARQREAYIAQMVGQDLDQIAQDQFATLKYGKPLSIRFNSAFKPVQGVPDATANDFLTVGTGIADGYRFWGDNFDWWMKLEGQTLADKRAALQQQADKRKAELEQARTQPASAAQERRVQLLTGALEGLETQLARSDDELTYVAAALGLKQQAHQLDAKLGRLQSQLSVMQSFHHVIDEYLGTDATIDGAAVAKAAAAGAAVDPEEFPALNELVNGKKEEPK